MEATSKRVFDKKDTLLVKGIAISLMLFYHLFESADLLQRLRVNYEPFSQDVFLLLSGFGNICVAIFAFLSAYGITKGLMMKETETEAVAPGLKDMYREASGRYLKLVGNFAVMFISVNVLWFRYFDYVKLYGNGWQGALLAIVDMLGLSQLFGTPTLNMTWWYMELAVLIIFAIPLLYLLVKRVENYLIIMAFFTPFVICLQEDVKRYLLVVVFGVVAAKQEWFEKLSLYKIKKHWKLLLGLVLFATGVVVRQNFLVHSMFLWIVDAPIAVFICWFGTEFLGRIPGLSHLLRFLGKHSMNIFFIHTFFYMSIYQPYIYQFQYAALIYLVLLGVTLLYSVLLEGIKTIVYNVVTKIRTKGN